MTPFCVDRHRLPKFVGSRIAAPLGPFRSSRMRFSFRARSFVTVAIALVVPTMAFAQTAPDEVSGTGSLTGYTQFNTNLDSGGRFNWSGGIAKGSVTRKFTPQLAAGLVARYEYQSWNFNTPTAFGN